MSRQRLRPVRRRTQHPHREVSGIRRRLASFGGLWTIALIGGAVVVVLALVVGSRPTLTSRNVSDSPLQGTAVAAHDEDTDRTHTQDASDVESHDGGPPARGPHFATAQRVGVYQNPVADGNAIHSLEHGVVWIAYNPTLIQSDVVRALEDLGRDYGVDTIVSPRPENTAPISATSWGQILNLESFDRGQLAEFIETNRNRSPEPFVR